MPVFRAVSQRLHALLWRKQLERDLEDEVAFHLSMREADQRQAGMDGPQAHRTARLNFGNVALVKDQTRDVWIWPWLQDLLRDARFAGRLLAKERLFTLSAVAALALGIGATTTAFTFVNAAMLRALPFQNPDQLVTLRTADTRGRGLGVSQPDFGDWQQSSRTLSDMAVFVTAAMNVGETSLGPERYSGSYISTNAFRMLGRAPILGRDFRPEDERAGAPPVAMIAHTVWVNRYAGDRAVIGRTVRINDVPSTIIGVMPDRFHFPYDNEVWQPVSLSPPGINDRTKRETRSAGVMAYGRLATSVTLPEAQAELKTIANRLAQAYPASNRDITVSVDALRDSYVGGLGDVLMLLMGAVTCVLVIACVNVASLLLSRSTRRAHEMAVRAALGATRGRIVRQLIIESLVLAILAGIVGFFFAQYGVQFFSMAFGVVGSEGPPPFWLDFRMDGRVLGFLVVACLVTTLLFGLAPALHISRTDINDHLREGGRGSSEPLRARRFTSTFMVAELALTLMLLTTAGLMMRSFLRMYQSDIVIDPSNLITMQLAPSIQKYTNGQQRRQLLEQLDDHLTSNRAFTSATVASATPLMGNGGRQVTIEGRAPSSSSAAQFAGYIYVGRQYFDTLGLTVLRGRPFSERDGMPGQEAVLVNERFRAMFFADEDPLGHRLLLINPIAPTTEVPWVTIVGVVPSIPPVLGAPMQPVVYGTMRGEPAPIRYITVIARGRSDSAAATAELRKEIGKVDPDLPGYGIRTMDDILSQTLRPNEIFGAMFALLAGIGLVLSAVGLYGVTAQGVAQRTKEIGVRMALGARRMQVVSLFVRRTIWQLVVGLVLGIAGAFGVARVMPTFLFRFLRSSQLDLVALGWLSLLLIGVAITATLIPARRAARVNPVIALRHD